MGNIFYRIGIESYYLLVWFASFFNEKAKLWIVGRRLKPKNTEGLRNTVLIHCSSYGEYEQASYLIKRYSEKYPEKSILLSFFSPSGFERIDLPEYISKKIYLPKDRSSNFEYIIDEFNIKELILVKYELWPNMLTTFSNNGVKLNLISARFYENHYVFSSFGKWVRAILRSFDSIHLIDQYSFRKLSDLGFTNIYLSGDTRFDRVLDVAQTDFKIDFHFSDNKPVIVFGSVWRSDFEILEKCFKELSSIYNFVVAPHEISKANIDYFESCFVKENISCQLKSNCNGLVDSVLIIDGIGELRYLYRLADISYIGGGFGSGLHNILEALVYGKPVLIGPNYQEFPEVINAVKSKVAFPINEASDLIEEIKLAREKTDDDEVKGFISQYTGASDRILQSV